MERSRNTQWRLGTIFVLLLCACAAIAQTQFGTITGRVTDKTGAVIGDAVVTLTDTSTQTSKEVKTGADGSFTFAAVVPSNYKLNVAKEGFGGFQKTFAVTPADRLTEDVSLAVGGSQTTVTVEANTVQVNTTTGDVSHIITTNDLQNMPLLTKNPYALIGLAKRYGDARVEAVCVTALAAGMFDVRRLERMLQQADVVRSDPDVYSFGMSAGQSTINSGTFFINLKPKDQGRTATADEVIRRLRPQLAGVQGINLYLQAG